MQPVLLPLALARNKANVIREVTLIPSRVARENEVEKNSVCALPGKEWTVV